MPRKSKVIRITLDSANVLDRISEKSGVPQSKLIDGWTAQLESVLSDFGDFQALTVLSYRPETKDGKKAECVTTRLGAVYLNSAEFIEKDLDSDISPEILANNRALEDFENKKVSGKVKAQKKVK